MSRFGSVRLPADEVRPFAKAKRDELEEMRRSYPIEADRYTQCLHRACAWICACDNSVDDTVTITIEEIEWLGMWAEEPIQEQEPSPAQPQGPTDKERLDWMESLGCGSVYKTSDNHIFAVPNRGFGCRGKTVREAIDGAIARQKAACLLET